MSQHSVSRRVLVVDDNRDAADLITEFLTISGFAAMPAYDGPSAIRGAEQFAPDVILLDIGMPGMDGFEVARTLRSAPAFAATRIVAFTAWGDPTTRALARNAGCDAHIVKPATFETILGVLALAAPQMAAPQMADEAKAA